MALARPRGFCAGVERAIEIVERALERYGPPVYVRHEIVHNRRVVDDLRARGAVFVDELDEIPDGATAVFSAHGVSRKVEAEAERRGLPVIDATCPLVTRVHAAARRHAAQGREVVLIGHRGHPEVEGTSGRAPGATLLVSGPADVASLRPRDPAKLAYVTQTTLSVDDTRETIAALKARFPAIVGPDGGDVCYATQNRQAAARALAQIADAILVVGARNSSNSNRLREIGEEAGVPSYLIDGAAAVDPRWLEDISTLGVTAGASAPESVVEEVVARIAELADIETETFGDIVERVRFNLPRSLRPGPVDVRQALEGRVSETATTVETQPGRPPGQRNRLERKGSGEVGRNPVLRSPPRAMDSAAAGRCPSVWQTCRS